MRIRDAARHLRVSARTLRHYEASGLISPRRGENGYRRLSETDLQRAAWVRDLIALGFSTRELRELVTTLEDGEALPACVAALNDKLDQIDRLAAQLEKRRRAVIDRLEALNASEHRSRPRRVS